MNDTKIAICILAALFILAVGMILMSNFLAKRITDGWLTLAALIFGMSAITCFVAAQTRVRNDENLRDIEHDADRESES